MVDQASGHYHSNQYAAAARAQQDAGVDHGIAVDSLKHWRQEGEGADHH